MKIATIITSSILFVGLAVINPQVSFGKPEAGAGGGAGDTQKRGVDRQRGGPTGQLMEVLKSLELSQDQQSKIRPIIMEAGQRIRSETGDQTLPAEDRRNAAKAIMTETRQAISEILDEDQRVKFDAAIQEVQNRRAIEKGDKQDEKRKTEQAQGGKAKTAPNGREVFRELGGLVQELNLDDQQQVKVKTILQDAGQELRDLMQSDSNEKREKAGFARELISSAKRDIGEVLTPEQRAVFEPKFEAIVAGAQDRRLAGGQLAGGRDAQAKGNGEATSRPAAPKSGDRRQAGGENRAANMLARLEEAIDGLNLDESQQKQADEAIAEVRTKLRALRDNNNESDPSAIRRRAREIFEDGLTQLRAILSPDQRDQLREAMRPPGGARDGADGGGANGGSERGPERGGNRPKGGPENKPSAPESSPASTPASSPEKSGAKSDGSMTDSSMDSSATNDTAKNSGATNQAPPTEAASSVSDQPQHATIDIGQKVPDFALNRLDGKAVTLASFKSRPVVLIFGSYTSPSFRQRVQQFQSLAKEFDKSVDVVVIYTAEAHPKGEWEVERNQQEGIEVAKHLNMDERFAAARLARDKLKLSTELMPIVPDKMDDAFTHSLGGFPNGMAIIDGSGQLYARQKWADVFAARTQLETLLKVSR